MAAGHWGDKQQQAAKRLVEERIGRTDTVTYISNMEVPVVEVISDMLLLVCWQWWRDEPRVVMLL